MQNAAWKWLFNAMDDAALSRICREQQVRVQGFRGYNYLKQLSAPAIRGQVVNALLTAKTLLKIQTEYSKTTDAELLALRQLPEAALQSRVRAGENPQKLLLALLTSSDASQNEAGERLVKYMQDNGLPSPSGQGGESDLTLETEEEEEELDDLTLVKLQFQLALGQKEELEKNLRKSEKRVERLEADLAKQRERYQHDSASWATEKQQLLQRLADSQRQSQSLQAELQAQSNLLAESQVAAADRQLPAEQTTLRSGPSVRVPANIVLIGDIPPNSLSQLGVAPERHLPSHRLASDLPQVVTEATEVWLLTYAVPLMVQMRLRRALLPERLHQFATYQELLHYIAGGM